MGRSPTQRRVAMNAVAEAADLASFSSPSQRGTEFSNQDVDPALHLILQDQQRVGVSADFSFPANLEK